MIFKCKALFQLLKIRGVNYIVYLVSGYLIPQLIKKIYLVFDEDISVYGLKRYYYITLAIVAFSIFLLSSIFIQKTMTAIFISVILILSILIIRTYLNRAQLRTMVQQAQDMMEEGRYLGKIKFLTYISAGITEDDIEKIKKDKDEADEVILAEIDQNGRAIDTYGVLGFLSLVEKEDFVPKDRFKLNVILKDHYVLVAKYFEGDNVAFIREWFFLSLLQLEVNVPAVWGVNKSRNIIYMNLVRGKSLNEMIAEAGGEVRQSDSSMSSNNGTYIKNQLKVDKSARVWGKKILDEDLLSELSHQLDLIHSKGVVGVSLKPGNVIVSKINRKPYVVDFHSAKHKRPFSFTWRILRDRDRIVANRRCGLKVLTERMVNKRLQILKLPDEQIDNRVYAPIDFGGGHAIGAFWNVTSGTGRWKHFMREQMPDLKDKRILDLGSNNGCMPLMMLRAGAREVLGIEISHHYVEQSQIIKDVFEWRDLRSYNFLP